MYTYFTYQFWKHDYVVGQKFGLHWDSPGLLPCYWLMKIALWSVIIIGWFRNFPCLHFYSGIVISRHIKCALFQMLYIFARIINKENQKSVYWFVLAQYMDIGLKHKMYKISYCSYNAVRKYLYKFQMINVSCFVHLLRLTIKK